MSKNGFPLFFFSKQVINFSFHSFIRSLFINQSILLPIIFTFVSICHRFVRLFLIEKKKLSAITDLTKKNVETKFKNNNSSHFHSFIYNNNNNNHDDTYFLIRYLNFLQVLSRNNNISLNNIMIVINKMNCKY